MADKKNNTQELIIEDTNSIEYLEKKKKALKKIIAVSSGIDLVMSVPESFTMFQTLGGSVIIEEIIEYFISTTIGKYSLDTDVSWSDRTMGFIPIPGVTGLTIRCFKEIRKINKKIKQLESFDK